MCLIYVRLTVPKLWAFKKYSDHSKYIYYTCEYQDSHQGPKRGHIVTCPWNWMKKFQASKVQCTYRLIHKNFRGRSDQFWPWTEMQGLWEPKNIWKSSHFGWMVINIQLHLVGQTEQTSTLSEQSFCVCKLYFKELVFFQETFPWNVFPWICCSSGKTLWFFMQWYVLEKHFSVFEMYFIDVFGLLGEKLSFCIVFSFTGLFGRRQKEANINLELSPSPRMQISFCSFDFHEQWAVIEYWCQHVPEYETKQWYC